MQYLNPSSVYGDMISLARTHPRHMGGTAGKGVAPFSAQQAAAPGTESTRKETTFGNLLFQALNTVNNVQRQSLSMNEKLVTDPNQVNVHEVTTALAEANLTLSITKAIAERVISAYREIINIR